MSITERVENLIARMHDEPQYPTQCAVLFIDLTNRSQRKAYLPQTVMQTFLSGRGANMFLLYNLLPQKTAGGSGHRGTLDIRQWHIYRLHSLSHPRQCH